MNKIYAGIGSRETPQSICMMMYDAAFKLARKGYTLRSGGAEGADTAFELGCADSVMGKKEIFLPWPKFNNNLSILMMPTIEAHAEARRFHPNWKNLSQAGQNLTARNAHQILGSDLKTPVDFVLYWTFDGSAAGGTGQGLRMAKFYEIPTYCIGRADINHLLS
jgi:hypothetical protein